ncbi:BMP family ABC transporter substrate-binding protein [Echinimonas agarilytica]|uniref:BMP family ABC transporter substrate-binding protein n=1 Tax=Echinimonas agarilytica TaxID=1215918 RepID=A0AA41W705_9GAMM|nr:BMP family ABC transporter substrate-binding protein [Echinimonas agarilytica]MCM2680210.1 BMP family ABC transporter substrate-binding protein [Echinimonas agarilytica]
MKLSKLKSVIGLAALVFAGALAAEPLKVGFVYVSPIGDAGWTYMHEKGRLQVAEEFGDKIDTSFVESVAEGADAERVIRKMAQSGYDLIFTTSFGYMNPTLKAAKRFPKVTFEHATGYKKAKNVGNYMTRDYEARYLAGMVAGAMSQTNVLGYVGAFPIPEVVRGINAYMLGAQQMNPDITMKVIWVNTWHDPAREREAAESLMLQGADVLAMHTDSPAVIQAAEANGKYATGFNSDMSAYGPNSHLTSAMQHWDSIYRTKIKAVLDGSWKPTSVWDGLKQGANGISPIHPRVPADVVAKVEQHKAQIIAGERSVFQGPVMNQKGEVKVAKGASLTDSELLKFGWYVKGVEGQIPQ